MKFWSVLPFNPEAVRDVERERACSRLDGHHYHFLCARAESENAKYRNGMYTKHEEDRRWTTSLFSYRSMTATKPRSAEPAPESTNSSLLKRSSNKEPRFVSYSNR